MFWCKHSNNAVMLCLYSHSMLIKQLGRSATGLLCCGKHLGTDIFEWREQGEGCQTLSGSAELSSFDQEALYHLEIRANGLMFNPKALFTQGLLTASAIWVCIDTCVLCLSIKFTSKDFFRCWSVKRYLSVKFRLKISLQRDVFLCLEVTCLVVLRRPVTLDDFGPVISEVGILVMLGTV